MSNIKSAFANYPISHDASHVQELPAADNAEHFHDHGGLFLWGKAGDVDLFFGATMYHIGGRKWSFEDGAFNQSFLLVTPNGKADRTMQDNAFVSNRMDPMCRFDFKETVTANRVSWQAGNREMNFTAPTWEVKGEHFGIDLDIKFRALHGPVPYHGDWEVLVEQGAAGNEVLCRGEGTCTYKGKTYTIENGWGVRERTCFGKNADVPAMLGTGGGYLWSWTFAEEIKVFYFSQEGSGHHAGKVFLKDRQIDFVGEQTTAEVLETWTDPLTHETKATSMRITMKSDQGELELQINTWRRMIFGFHLLEAYTTHTGKAGRATGKFTLPDGTVLPIDDEICYMEHGFATPNIAA